MNTVAYVLLFLLILISGVVGWATNKDHLDDVRKGKEGARKAKDLQKQVDELKAEMRKLKSQK